MTAFTAARKTTRLAIAAFAIGGLPLVGCSGAEAQPRPPVAGAMQGQEHDQQHAQNHAREHGRANRIEGRIAYLKAELKITPAQEAQWSAVADAMRRSATARQQLWEEMRGRGGKPMTAVEHLMFRQRASELQADSAKTFATTFAALYTRMDDAQKKQADELLSPHRHHRL